MKKTLCLIGIGLLLLTGCESKEVVGVESNLTSRGDASQGKCVSEQKTYKVTDEITSEYTTNIYFIEDFTENVNNVIISKCHYYLEYEYQLENTKDAKKIYEFLKEQYDGKDTEYGKDTNVIINDKKVYVISTATSEPGKTMFNLKTDLQSLGYSCK